MSLFSFIKHIYTHKKIEKLETLNKITISKSKIIHNYSALKSLQSGDSLFPVVKSNAYGHGIQQICEILKETDTPYICADSFPEYQVIKNTAHKKTLLIGESDPSAYSLIDPKRCTPVVYNKKTLELLVKSGKKRCIHLFLNTGMNREGIQLSDIPYISQIINTNNNLILEGVMSHLSHADDIGLDFCDRQIDVFKRLYSELLGQLNDGGQSILYRHIGNSAGIAKIDDSFFNAWRSGINIYGYNPLEKDDPTYKNLDSLRPALDIYSTVVAIQEAKTGEYVSYSGIYTNDKPTRYITIPFGYAEGLNRLLSNNRTVTTLPSPVSSGTGEGIPLAGRVCMNLSCYDIGNLDMSIGDQVKVISSDPQEHNTILAFAEKTGTLHYEVLVKIASNIRREVVA